MGGFLFDLMGRFKTVAILFTLMGVSTIAIPFVSPSIPAFIVCRTVLQCSLSPLLMNPFVNDYVVVRQRSAGMAMQNFGLTFGSIFSIAALLTITHQMPVTYGFLLSGGLNFLYIATFWGASMIQEPSVNEDKEGKRRAKKSIFGQMSSQLRLLWKACQADTPLMVGIFCVVGSRYSIIMAQVNFLTWMTDLNEKHELGIKNIPVIWQRQVVIS